MLAHDLVIGERTSRMLDTTKRTIATLTAAACLGGGGWAIASSSNGSSGGSTPASTTAADSSIAAGTATYGAPPQGQPQQAEVTGDAAAKVEAAVLAKVPGATIDRVEQDAQGYHAHITKSDGTRATVFLNAQFAVTAVEAGRGPGGGPGPAGGPGGPCPDRGAQDGGGGGSSGESPAPAAAAGQSGTSET
jgi:hypothetical protein